MSAKRTLAWIAAALAASSLLYTERDGIRSLWPAPDRSRVRITYRYFSPVYNALVNPVLLGQERPCRSRVVALADLHPGDVVLDLACGTGRNFPYVLDRIGPNGLLIGFDYTPEMLQHAQQAVDERGWRNVVLLQGDAAQLSAEELSSLLAAGADGVDAVISTFALCVIPGWEEALRRAVAVLKPGGRLVVGDVKLSERPLMRPFNLLADLLGGAGAGDLGRRPWLFLPQLLDDVTFEDRFFGFFYVTSGRKPT